MLLALLMLLFGGISGARATTWLDADIGAPTVAGSHTENAGAVTVTGAGTGDTTTGADQLHYTYTTASGDTEVIARLSGFTGNAHAHAGIMLRDSNAANATTAQVVFKYQDNSDGKNVLGYSAHDAATTYGGSWSATPTYLTLPIWLRIDRVGKNFAVYKSTDGFYWTMITNNSGWQFAPTGTIEVGFFAAGGAANVTCSATFDTITIGTPNLGYKTSWFGETFGGNLSDGHVSNSISALWTAPDGRCFTNSPYDEEGEATKIYKDGAVLHAPRDGNEMCGGGGNEGSVASDGTYTYWAGGHYLVQSDMLVTYSASKHVDLSIDSYDAVNGRSVISGVATGNNEIYISDSSTGKIRVAVPHPTLYYYASANNSAQKLTTQTIDTTGVPNAAPMAVYQSQRANDFTTYTIPGLTPNTNYTLRCHCAEYTETQTGKAMLTVGAGGNWYTYDIIALAGGRLKALVIDIPNVSSDGNGTLAVNFAGGNICGFELLTGGTSVFAINCGGPQVNNFISELYELPTRAFRFDRPGPIAVDSRGDLWIIREANDFPIGTKIATKYNDGAVLCYHPNGTFTGKQINIVNPVALAYDATNDRLLVADNSSNQDIAIYNNLAATPTFYTSFGVTGGLYAGSHPGLCNDPASGGYKRFYGLSGVGIDAAGNIYVSSNLQGSDLRKFDPAGNLVWKLNSLLFCNCPDVDPDSDGAEAYTTYSHASMNYANTAPGSEWSQTGYNWNPQLYSDAPRQPAAQTMMRRVGASRALIQYTSGQGSVGYVGIYRYAGEIAVPCGQIRNDGAQVWIDANGNGVEDAGEVTNTGVGSPGSLDYFSVDTNGDVWLACMAYANPVLRHFKCNGLTAQGAPIYGTNTGDYEDIPFPDPGLGPINMWVQSSRVSYDSVHDVMYLAGPANTRTTSQDDATTYLARYDNWSTGNRTARWQCILDKPGAANANFMYEVDRPWGCAHGWMGFDVAEDKCFVADLWGQVNAYDANTGALEAILSAGPEVSGNCAWEDARMGLTAFKRSTGEYVIFTENSGYDGKANMFRWSGPAVATPNYTPAGGTYTSAQSVTLTCATAGATIYYTTDGSTPSRTSAVYSTPIAVTGATTIKAIACTGTATSAVSTGVFYLQCATPAFSLPAGGYGSAQTVTISTTTSGATIRYTTDGTTPTETVGTVYTGPITINAGFLLKAIAYKPGILDSAVASGQYIIQATGAWYTDPLTQGAWWSSGGGYVYGSNGYVLCDWNGADIYNLTGSYVQSVTPTGQYPWCWAAADQSDPRATINPATGTHSGACWASSGAAFDVLVTLVNPNDGVQHRMAVYCLDWDHYGPRSETLDLLDPSTGLTKLTGGPVTLSNFNGTWVVFYFTGNAKLHVVNTNGNSNAVIAAIAFDTQCALPTFSPTPGTYSSPQNVTISSATSGATSCYTTDGSTPSETNGTVYTTPVNIGINTTLKAIAYKTGMADSPVTAGTYAINFDPTLIAGLELWLRADTLTQSGGTVTAWPDKSLAHQTVTVTGGPAYQAANTGINNQPSVNFDFNDDRLDFPRMTDIRTVFWVLKKNAASNGYSFLLGDTTNYDFHCGDPWTSGQSHMIFDKNWASANVRNGTTTLNGTVIDGTTTYMPTMWSVLSVQTTGPVTASSFALDRSLPGRLWDGDLAELLVFNTALSSQDVAAVTNYLTARYNLAGVNNPPTEWITSPTNYAIVTAPATVAITANATDCDGTITKVDFYQGATLLGTCATSPYSYTWTNVAAGYYVLTAKATDNSGASTTSMAIGITVQDQCATPTFTPAAGTYTAAQNVTISTTTSGASIRYTTDGTTPSDTVGTLYSSAVNISATTTLKAIAYKTGMANSAVVSGVYTIDAPPTVSLTAPANNTTYIAPASVTINATASDSDGTISKVEFYQGSTLLGTDSTSPYSYTWTNVAMGNYSLTAKAYDNYNVATTSTAVNIIVWGTSDVGSVGVAGSASYSGTTFTVSGAGAGIDTAVDTFRYVYRQLSGNTTIIARIATTPSALSTELAGVMMRNDLTSGSVHASALYKPTSTYYVYFKRRTNTNGSTATTTSSSVTAAPYWVKLVRNGTTLSAYLSANGTSWTQVGTGQTMSNMTSQVYVGLAVTSGSISSAKTVTFDNVSITQP